jgi:lysocardiolipin and lysophospholipid acyltransferase
LRGIVFIICFTAATFITSLFFFPTSLFLLFPSLRVTKLRRAYIGFVTSLFADYIAALIYFVSGTKIFIYSDDAKILNEDKNVFVICNHRTRIDWIYCYWFYFPIIKIGEYMRCILKDALKSVPIYGWAMQMSLYVFLMRSKTADVPQIYNVVSFIRKTSKRLSILIFPEGTDLSDSNLAKSHAFSTEKNLRQYKYVLHPKPSGFFACLQALRPANGGFVHDITIAYKDAFPGQRPDEKSILLGLTCFVIT